MSAAEKWALAPAPRKCDLCEAPADQILLRVVRHADGETLTGPASSFCRKSVRGDKRLLHMRKGYRFDAWVVRCWDCKEADALAQPASGEAP